jgi:protein-S-isoprenylcysteine O-methyltransferase Ste14
MKIPIPPVLFLLCLVMMCLLGWLLPIVVLWTMPCTLYGLVPLAIGLFLTFAGGYQFKKMKTNTSPLKPPTILVTDGIYRYSRNPMYLGLVLALLGVWTLWGSLSPLAAVIAFILIIDRWQIPSEEKMLKDKFGSEYENYKSKTRRWV